MKERPVAGAVLAGRRFLSQRPVVVVAVLFLGAVAATLAYVQGLQTHLVDTQALQNAELLTATLGSVPPSIVFRIVPEIPTA